MNNNDIIHKIEEEINNDIKVIVNKLEAEKLLTFLLMQQEIIFSILEAEKPEYKETLSESFSYAINLVIHYKKIKLHKLQNYNISDYVNLKKKTLDNLISLLLTKSKISDFKVYIYKQGYKLNIENEILTITHEIDDYIKYYKLGYLRNVMEDMYMSMMAHQGSDANFLKVIQKALERQIDFFKIMDKGSSTERIRFLFSEPLCHFLTNLQDKNTDYRINTLFSNYFIHNNIDINDKCSKSTNIRWIDLLKFSIGLSNISMFMDNTIKEQCLDNHIMFNNSILFPMPDKSIFEVFQLIFREINEKILEDDIKKFIKKFTSDLTKSKIDDKIDIQFKPIVKVGENFNYLLFRTFGATNIIRAYLSNHNIGLDDQGNRFEETVKNIFSTCFPNVKDKIKFKTEDNQEGEIDICVVGNDNIYFVECKNRLHPISASSSINNYEYIMKASQEQLPKAVNYFNENRTLFIQKHFKTCIENIENFKTHKIVLLSNRNVSGLNIDDVAVRDIYSLERVLEIGYSSIGFVSSSDNTSFEDTAQKIHFWENESFFQEIDFINFLSKESKFFKFIVENIAVPQERYFHYKNYTLSDFVYAYEAFKK